MARPSKPSAAKRARERAKLSKKEEKKLRRVARSEEKSANLAAGVDTTIADEATQAFLRGETIEEEPG